MYDIHHHLLYGLDDGARSLEMSLEMIEMAADDGISHIVCTPHSSHRYTFDPQANQEKVADLRQRSSGRVTLGLGCDFHLSYDNIQDAIKDRSRFSINGGQYLLIEFPDIGIPQQISEALYELRLAGLTLIITHPERNPLLRADTARMTDWLHAGHLIQVTAGALTGRFGRTAEKHARDMLDRKWVHFIATDAHNTDSRPPHMRNAFDIICRDYGREYAELLCVTNPKAAFENSELPPQFEMTFDEPEIEKPKGFLRRIFST